MGAAAVGVRGALLVHLRLPLVVATAPVAWSAAIKLIGGRGSRQRHTQRGARASSRGAAAACALLVCVVPPPAWCCTHLCCYGAVCLITTTSSSSHRRSNERRRALGSGSLSSSTREGGRRPITRCSLGFGLRTITGIFHFVMVSQKWDPGGGVAGHAQRRRPPPRARSAHIAPWQPKNAAHAFRHNSSLPPPLLLPPFTTTHTTVA